MNKFKTNEIVNFLKIKFVQPMNFCTIWRDLHKNAGKILLDRQEILWYYYSIKIGKKSAHFRVTCVLFAFCRRFAVGASDSRASKLRISYPFMRVALLAGVRAQITGLPRFQFAGGNANEKTKVHKTCMPDHDAGVACK